MALIITILVFAVLYLIVSLHFLVSKDTGNSYSLIQTWKEYHSLNNWNLPTHAILDIDNDGTDDLISYTGCAHISSVNDDFVPVENQCDESEFTFPFIEEDNTLGQIIRQDNNNFFLRKSYLVRTQENDWKVYDISAMKMKIWQLDNTNMFVEVDPTIKDRIDHTTFITTNFGTELIVMILGIILPWA